MERPLSSTSTLALSSGPPSCASTAATYQRGKSSGVGSTAAPQDRLGDHQRLAHRAHVVDPEDLRPVCEREHVGSHGAAQALANLAVGDLRDEALARGPDAD